MDSTRHTIYCGLVAVVTTRYSPHQGTVDIHKKRSGATGEVKT